MKVVLDTNIFLHTQKRLLHGVDFEILESALQRLGITIVVPRIVVAEAKNQYREALDEQRKTLKKLEILFLRPFSERFTDDFLPDAVKEYERALDARLEALNAIKPDHADIPHDDLVQRDLARRKPFTVGGKGYRDALIWEVIQRQIASADTVTYLITDNYTDFGDEAGELHPDLQEDLRQRRLPEGAVKLLRSVAGFNEQLVKPSLALLDDLRQKLESRAASEVDLLSFFNENVEDISDASEEMIFDLGDEVRDAFKLPGPADSVGLAGVTNAELHRVIDVRQLNNHRVVVTFEIVCDAYIFFFIDPETFASTRNTSQFFENEIGTDQVNLGVDADLTFEIEVVLNRTIQEVTEWVVRAVHIGRT